MVVVLLQLGLGIAAEWVLYLKDPGYADKERKLARLAAETPGAPTVEMLGSSRACAGFEAGRVRDQLAPVVGRKAVAFNFGIPASGPVTHLVYLRRLLADGHRPDLLLLEVLPPMLADIPPAVDAAPAPNEARFLFGDRLRRAEAETVIAYGFPADTVRSRWRQSVLVPWYALRLPLLGRVAPSALPWHLRFDWSRTGDEFGWAAPPLLTVTREQYEEGLTRAIGEYRDILADLHPNGGAARGLADLLALCREQQLPVKLVLMPEAVEFRALYPPEAVVRVDQFLTRLCQAYGCERVDAREWLPDSAFADGHHLLKPGAAAFTDRLTQDVIVPFFRGRGGVPQ